MGQIEESVDGQNPGPEAPPRSKKRQEEGAKEMSGEERWRRVEVSGSLRGRSQILPPRGGRK